MFEKFKKELNKTKEEFAKAKEEFKKEYNEKMAPQRKLKKQKEEEKQLEKEMKLEEQYNKYDILELNEDIREEFLHALSNGPSAPVALTETSRERLLVKGAYSNFIQNNIVIKQLDKIIKQLNESNTKQDIQIQQNKRIIELLERNSK